jgi:hypothetical protein
MSQPAQQQEPPGTQAEMTPRPDCGEQSYVGYGRLDGKVAVITGGDSGIGRAVAIAYAREGADVVLSYLDEHEDAKDTAQYVEQAGRRAVLIAGDMADPQQCRDIVDTAVHELGKIDVLVNTRVSDEPRVAGGDPGRGVGPHLGDQRLGDVPPLQGRGAAHVRGRRDHRQLVGQLRLPVADAGAVRRHQGRDRQLLREPGPAARSAWHPGQQRRARPDLSWAQRWQDAPSAGSNMYPG